MSIPLSQLIRLLPRRLLRRCANAGDGALQPFAESATSAVLFADIAGFTDFSERLARKGPSGPEELTAALNAFFQPLIEVILKHGGDVLKMAGDALVVEWEAQEAAQLGDAVFAAARCAQEIQQRCGGFVAPDGSKLSLSIGIGAGPTQFLYVGGLETRWEMVPLGTPFQQMGEARNEAKAGEIVLAPQAWKLIGAKAEGESLPAGGVRLTGTKPGPLPEPAPEVKEEGLDPEVLQCFVPRAMRYLPHGAGQSWLAELRTVTVLIVLLPHEPGSGGSLAQIQALMDRLQTAIYRYEGSVNNWVVDEKGMSLLAVFGLPPGSHEDDPYRGMQAALAIQTEVDTADLKTSIGVTTGRAFCGPNTDAQRHEYTILGSFVNLAARLAQSSDGRVFCDQSTFQSTVSRMQYAALPPSRLKGIPRSVAVYVPSGSAPSANGAANMVGHAAELEALSSAVDRLETGKSYFGLVEGAAGIGKSTLVSRWTKTLPSRGVRLSKGAAESIHANTPYFAWKGLLESLFEFPDAATPEQRSEQVLASSRGTPWERLAPLLDDVLDLGIPENEITAQMAGKIRADSTRALIVDFLGAEAARGRLCLVLEDCHWMDSASVAVAAAVAESVKPVVMVCTARDAAGEADQTLAALLGVSGAQRLQLFPLDPAESIQLVTQRLGVRRVEKSVADLIVSKSQGNPFFSLEIAFALREQGFVIIEGDTCAPSPALDLASVKFPDNVQGLITQRLDKLDSEVQMAAKLASVVGRSFPVSLLRETYPMADARLRLDDHLQALQEERLIERGDDEGTFAFTHALVEEAIYERMLFSHRKSLHEKVAETLERTHREDPDPVAELLGHHWAKAGHDHKAGHYFGLAGMRAVRRGAYRESLAFLDQAISFRTAHQGEPEEIIRHGRWRRLRAESLLGLGRLAESSSGFRNAADVLGAPVDGDGLKPTLLQKATRRLARALKTRHRTPSAAESEHLRELSACFEMVSILDLFSNRMSSSLAAAKECLRHAETLGDSEEYARALATMALASSLVPSHALANRYAEKAIKVAERLDQEMTMSRVLELVGMYYLGHGRWEDAERCFTRAIEGFRIVGDRRREIECTCLFSTYYHYRGDFPKRVELGKMVSHLALLSGDLQAQAWGLLDQIESWLNLGDFEQVRSLGRDLRTHIGQNIYGADEIMAFGLLAALDLRAGDFQSAVEAADKALAVMTKVSPTIVYNMEAYGAVADVYFHAWANASQDDNSRAAFREKAREATKCVREFAKVFRIGVPRAFLVEARESELQGHLRQALRLSNTSLAIAVKLGMPYEEALARRQIARMLPARDQRRADELTCAARIFERLKARYDSEIVAAMQPGLTGAG